jgi:orotate phosphoribosyltransferase
MMNPEQVLELIKKGYVFELSPDNFDGRLMIIQEMVAILNHFDVFWQYEGDPRPEVPHALLKSGKHSNGFIICDDVLQFPRLCTLFAHEVVKVLEEKNLANQIDVVANSAYSAITLGWEVARLLSLKHNKFVEYRRAEKDEKGNPTIIRSPIARDKRVLILNELMTTGGGSTWETKQAVLKCNGNNPAPTILERAIVLIHRSKDWKLADGSPVLPIFHLDIENYNKDQCPYCAAGSEAIKPKIDNNWARLHGV